MGIDQQCNQRRSYWRDQWGPAWRRHWRIGRERERSCNWCGCWWRCWRRSRRPDRQKNGKQQAELEKIEGAKVEAITDANNLQAIKVTFDSGILFATGKSDLSASSKASLVKFANSLKENPETDVTIYGHTDNTGSREVNVKLSNERAESVAKFLISNGVSGTRLTTQGKAYDEPVADNSTAEGRAQNRRVEIYITANEQMIKQAEDGTLK
jgi:outer membrane protein OmpA-like peptidoglycan-associated protein